ncbi:MFS transporter [Kalamiella sp. sgz302252]|uniref:MFS transporter n=1 Tax=Pantoea sp. sgz302252 TaxID=3341827 RepID=UPI0036D25625
MQRNIRLFAAYRVISRCYFHLPVLLFYFWLMDTGMYRIIALLAIYGLSSTFCASLSGILLRAFSQKQVVAIGELAKAAGLALILWGTRQTEFSVAVLGIAQIIGGAGFSIALSTDSSLLRQIVRPGGDPGLFMQVQTRTQSQMFIATLLAGTAGSILFDYNPQWPFFASLLASLLSVLVILPINEPPQPAEEQGAVKPAALQLLPQQQFWMIFYSLSRAFTLAPFIGFIPFYFIMVNVEPLLFGAVLSFFTLSAFAAAKVGNVIIQRYGVNMLLALTVMLMLGALLLFGFSSELAAMGIDYFISGLAAIGLLGLGSGAIRPVTMANLDVSQNSAAERMHIFGRMERDFGLANGLLLMAGAVLLVNQGVEALMIAFSGFYLLSMAGLIALRRYHEKALTPC